MLSYVKADDSFEKIGRTWDVIALLALINKSFCCSFDTKTYGVMATVKVMKRTNVFYQKDGVNNQTYHCKIVAQIETTESYGRYGTIGVEPTMLKALLKKMHQDSTISSTEHQ